MNLHRILFAIAAVLSAGGFSVAAQSSNETAAVYVPDMSHRNDPLTDKVLRFDGPMKTVEAVEGQDFARCTFSFTNVTPDIVTVLEVHPSCQCTKAELPPLPWQIAPGASGEMKVSVDLAGKMGTMIKSIGFVTDKGWRDLRVTIVITPAPTVKLTEDQMAAGIAAAKVDSKAIFKGDCASCHLKNVAGKYGPELYKNACAICHDAENRATMVPDLAQLKVPTSEEFWKTWITYGKPGTLMPAWAQSQGGPLDSIQIASLAQLLNMMHPSKVAPAGP